MPKPTATEPGIAVFQTMANLAWGANVVMQGTTCGEARYDFESAQDAWNWALDTYSLMAALAGTDLYTARS